ncbi:hypothetical protein SISNIDRAFT_553312 [Sistotremastrum niveocremeum HHB9708]|uniref:Uncharacterized protein n=2 Tax=Sistotremastraceae TaxID=3402574 RepID=A0A164MWG2_9AGAM|nr:hypothetical protein SISNIDRAFT_553312 [Sistotremastrum niveocremeum HHB9708]KZT32047.1 hypothetical protein SISSUDRAFT_1133391 [Sistotremastrum suecicum HHB10207 ss-3]
MILFDSAKKYLRSRMSDFELIKTTHHIRPRSPSSISRTSVTCGLICMALLFCIFIVYHFVHSCKTITAGRQKPVLSSASESSMHVQAMSDTKTDDICYTQTHAEVFTPPPRYQEFSIPYSNGSPHRRKILDEPPLGTTRLQNAEKKMRECYEDAKSEALVDGAEIRDIISISRGTRSTTAEANAAGETHRERLELKERLEIVENQKAELLQILIDREEENKRHIDGFLERAFINAARSKDAAELITVLQKSQKTLQADLERKSELIADMNYCSERSQYELLQAECYVDELVSSITTLIRRDLRFDGTLNTKTDGSHDWRNCSASNRKPPCVRCLVHHLRSKIATLSRITPY